VHSMFRAKVAGQLLKQKLVSENTRWLGALRPQIQTFLRKYILTWTIFVEGEDGKPLRTITPHPDCTTPDMKTAIVTIGPGPGYCVKEKGEDVSDADPEAFFKIVLKQAQRLAPDGYLASLAEKPDEALLLLGHFYYHTESEKDFPDLEATIRATVKAQVEIMENMENAAPVDPLM
jgi:hypothetical protein